MRIKRSEDLAPYLRTIPGRTRPNPTNPGQTAPSAELRQGTILAWDQSTGANTVDVNGTVVNNLPVLVNDQTGFQVGDIAGVLAVGASWYLVGRILVPSALNTAGPVGPADGPAVYAPQARASDMIYSGRSLAGMAGLGGGAEVLHDTSDSVIGPESAKVTTPASGATPCGFAVFSGPTLPNMTDKEPVLWLKCNGMVNTIDFKFWIGGSSLTNAYIWNLSEAGTEFPFLRDGDWWRITLPLGAATVNGSPPNLATLNSWQIKIFDDAVHPITLQLGGIGYVPRQDAYPNGVVTIRFDDLLKSTITKAAPYMAQYGFQSTSYVIAETIRSPGPQFINYANLEDAHSLEEDFGWEHASHAYLASVHNQTVSQGGTGTKGYTAYSVVDQLADMKACRDYLRQQGFRGADHFAWPQGAWDPTSRRCAKQLFSSVMTLAHANNETLPVADPYRVRSYAPPSSVTGGQLTAEVDKAIAGKEWLTILFHDIQDTVTDSLGVSTSAFQTFVDYLHTNNVPVRLTSDLLTRMKVS